MNRLLGITVLLSAAGMVASASPVTPTYTTFGTLSGATFGGSGIPNDAVAITTINDGNNTITLGLTATPRYSAPAVGNDGAGTFSATPGSASGKALWNFDFYYDATGGDYIYKLLYGTDASSLSSFDPTLISDNAATANNGGQNSENLVWFLGGFDPNAIGQYDFELQALDQSGEVLGQSAIVVNVGTVPDAASTALLLGIGLVGLATYSGRKNQLQTAK